jgi:hypothetical protein
MIMDGDDPSTIELELVQIVKGLGSIVSEEPMERDKILDVAQWQPSGDYFCES